MLEIILTLESAVDYIEDDALHPSNLTFSSKEPSVSPRKVSDLPPLPSEFQTVVVQDLTEGKFCARGS